jgi:hypothetical protein
MDNMNFIKEVLKLTFSNFAQMLYPIIGKGQKIPDFLLCLTNHIMAKPISADDIQKFDNDEYNPLAQKGPSMLQKIYRGSRKMPTRDAGEILSRLDKGNFSEYLCTFPCDVIELIGEALRKSKEISIDDEIPDVCSDLFALVLNDSVSRPALTPVSNKCEARNQIPKTIEQMIGDFEQAIDEYDIVGFMYGDFGDVLGFINYVRLHILKKTSYQKEDVYKNTRIFCEKLEVHCDSLCDVDPDMLGRQEELLRMRKTISSIISELDEEIDTYTKKTSVAEPDSDLQERLYQLKRIKRVFQERQDIDSLFGEICGGKTLLVY